MTDPLPSWRPGATRDALIAFLLDALAQRAAADPSVAEKPELLDYEFSRDGEGKPELRRTAAVLGHPDEGEPKVLNIQSQLGRPILAAGNSSGDKEMLEWAAAGPGPTLALLVDHDDAERDYAYAGEGATTDNTEAITAVARRLGWTVASMATDWETVL